MANLSEKYETANKLLKRYTARFINGEITSLEFMDNFTEDLKELFPPNQMASWMKRATTVIKEATIKSKNNTNSKSIEELNQNTIRYLKTHIHNKLKEGERLEEILRPLKFSKETLINVIGQKEYLRILEAEEENIPDGEWTKLKAQITPNIIDNLFQLYEEEKITLNELKLKIKKVTGYG
jgi:hypothetical protein